MSEQSCLASDTSIPHLVAQVYETAPPDLRSRLLEHLLRPLGVLSLVAVANGIFANILLRGGLSNMQVGVEDALTVQASDVIALVDRVQLVSVESIDGLARMIMASPMATGSAAAAMLVTILMQRTRSSQFDD